jgi:hypothetical protein
MPYINRVFNGGTCMHQSIDMDVVNVGFGKSVKCVNCPKTLTGSDIMARCRLCNGGPYCDQCHARFADVAKQIHAKWAHKVSIGNGDSNQAVLNSGHSSDSKEMRCLCVTASNRDECATVRAPTKGSTVHCYVCSTRLETGMTKYDSCSSCKAVICDSCIRYHIPEGDMIVEQWDEIQDEQDALHDRINASVAFHDRIDAMASTSKPFINDQDFEAYMCEVERQTADYDEQLLNFREGVFNTTTKRLRNLKRHPGCSRRQREDVDYLLDKIRDAERRFRDHEQRMEMEIQMHRMRLEADDRHYSDRHYSDRRNSGYSRYRNSNDGRRNSNDGSYNSNDGGSN